VVVERFIKTKVRADAATGVYRTKGIPEPKNYDENGNQSQ